MGGSQFGVPGSTAGTLFQIRYALLRLVRAASEDPAVSMWLERLDDIEIKRQNGHEIVQAKHHMRDAQVTDRAADLWRTLRVWCSLVATEPSLLQTAMFTLVTTATCSARSAISKLAGEGAPSLTVARTVANALSDVARAGGNEANQAGYDAFLSLPPPVRERLLFRAHVIDGSPQNVDIHDGLKNALRASVTGDAQLTALVERLEGWWSAIVAQHLQDARPLEAGDVLVKIREIADSLGPAALPLSSEVASMAPVSTVDEGKMYVKQLRLVDCGERSIIQAVTDFVRAERQISEWMREHLMFVNELARYKRKLADEWKIRFDALSDGLERNGADMATLSQMGRDLYQRIIEMSFPIRRDWSDGFVMRGTYHDLAESKDVGWHPEYRNLL